MKINLGIEFASFNVKEVFVLIRVVYQNNKYDYILDAILDRIISSNKLKTFYRLSEGWVAIGHDPTRGTGGSYQGPERRRSIRQY